MSTTSPTSRSAPRLPGRDPTPRRACTRPLDSAATILRPSDLGALTGFLRRLPREYRYCVEVRTARSSRTRDRNKLEGSGDVGAEWVTFDTTVLFESPPVSDAERRGVDGEATPAPPVARPHFLSRRPLHRPGSRGTYRRGLQHWLDAVAGWLREGRSPTVFIHTPDNVGALELARRFHDDVRARVPGVEPLPEPIPSGPPTLF